MRQRLERLTLKKILTRLKGGLNASPKRIRYADVVAHALEDLPDGSRFLPSVLPNWDNTPRSGVRGVVYEGATPELFERYLRKAVAKVAHRPPSSAIVFLKAWNEWAEGNYVEPDLTFGHRYLDAIRSVMRPEARPQSDDGGPTHSNESA